MDDVNLLEKIAKGDKKAFVALMTKYEKAVYGLGLRILKSSELAEDNAQDTWIRVVRAADQFSEPGNVKAWILKITKNLALNTLEKRGWEESLSEGQESQIEMAQEEISVTIEKAQTLQALKAAVDKLPDRQRVALVLWMFEEKSYSELSVELKINVNAVKVLLFRAKENIEKYMLQEKGEGQ
jgi:RNA polymerase sigma-70 factor (ECF subfamily)